MEAATEEDGNNVLLTSCTAIFGQNFGFPCAAASARSSIIMATDVVALFTRPANVPLVDFVGEEAAPPLTEY